MDSGPWDSPGRNTGVDSHFLLKGIFSTQGSNLGLPHCRQILYCLSHQEKAKVKSLSHVQLFATPWTVVHQVSLFMEFSRQEYWSGLLFLPPGTATCQASLSISYSWGLLKLTSIESVMPPTISSSVIPFSSNPQSFPASGSNESVLCIR